MVRRPIRSSPRSILRRLLFNIKICDLYFMTEDCDKILQTKQATIPHI